jgi:hypothetical protein
MERVRRSAGPADLSSVPPFRPEKDGRNDL